MLLTILLLVSLWGVHDSSDRQGRLRWDRTLDVALVLVQPDALDAHTLHAFLARIDALEQRLSQESSRYGLRERPPIRFTVYGPVSAGPLPPLLGGESLLDRLSEALARRFYTLDVDRHARVPLWGFDSRIYVVLRRPDGSPSRGIEGHSEQGGRLGFVDVELDVTMIDQALFVTTHELFHTLGATDKYGPGGRTQIPEGLVEPHQPARFPQRYVDVMAHGRPVSPEREVLLSDLSELGVGPATARELRWLP